MKTIKKVFLTMLVFALFANMNSFAQEEEKEFEPVFLTITTMHRTSDPDVDMSDWLETEKQYHDNVTMKNDLIIGSGVYFHYFSADDTEVISVSVYKSWGDIEAAVDRSGELVREAWPEEEARDAYFEKRNSYYARMHSDEIMSSFPFQINANSDSEEPLLFYVKKNQAGQGGKGFREYFDNITSKNKYVKGYYTHGHAYGSNSLDRSEVFVFESLGDIEKAFEEDNRLIMEHWPEEEARKEFFESYSKIFDGHSDAIYRNVPELDK